MEGGTLFNSGFLGAHFNWWIGQIADDSYWRDNQLPYKFNSKDLIPGWGKRYKVRIIGLHDQEEETIPSDQLPWAQVMYPVTGGGGQASSGQTANLRQGMFVFGFFLDGQDQQVPVIMGVLGNNAQTVLGTTHANYRPTSGFSTSTTPPAASSAVPRPPDHAQTVVQPEEGFPTIESVEDTHRTSVADIKRQEDYLEKTVLMSVCDSVQSAMKAIRTVLENLSSRINKILNAANSYIDAATSVVSTIRDLIANASCEIAKYMKVLFDMIMEYVLKQINSALSPTISAVPVNRRHQYADLKEQITEIISCVYTNITNNLCGQIDAFLNREMETQNAYLDDNNRVSRIQMCAVEQMVGSIISSNFDDMTSGLDTALNAVDGFLADIQQYLSTISSTLSGVRGTIEGLNGSITAALTFENLSTQVFGCDLRPNCPVSDFYTIQSGGSSQPTAQLPNPTATGEQSINPSVQAPAATPPTPYAQPTPASGPVTPLDE